MIDWIIAQDKALLLFLNGSDCVYLDAVMWTVTRTATWLLFFASLIYTVLRSRSRGEAVCILLLIALLVLFTDQISAHLIKPFFQRPRPTHDAEIGALVDIVNGYRAGQFGFVSSHASNTFGVATFLTLILRRRTLAVIFFLWAMLCSYSRIYLGVHYPGDIFCGALLGVASGFAFYGAYRSIIRYKCFPISHLSITDIQQRNVFLALLLSFIYIVVRAVFYAQTF